MAKTFRNIPSTVVTMIRADGDTGRTIYGVYQTIVRVPENDARGWRWTLDRAQLVGQVLIERGETRPSYGAMAKTFETPAYPALEA